MAHTLLCELLTSIQAAEHFMLFGDETRDVAKWQNASCHFLKWVIHYYVINDDLITLIK